MSSTNTYSCLPLSWFLAGIVVFWSIIMNSESYRVTYSRSRIFLEIAITSLSNGHLGFLKGLTNYFRLSCLCLIEDIYLPYQCWERLQVVCAHLAAVGIQVLILLINAISVLSISLWAGGGPICAERMSVWQPKYEFHGVLLLRPLVQFSYLIKFQL